MDDPVAEVLEQRAALDRGAAAGATISILLHGGAAALAVYAALHAPAPEMVNVLTIRMAPMSAPAAAPAPPAAPVLQEPRAEVEPARPVTAPPVPLPKNAAPPSPFGKSTKRAAEAVPPAPAPARPATGTGTASATDTIAPGTSGVTKLEGGDFPYTMYIENMRRLIGAHWFRPPVTRSVATTVSFVIDRDGSIRDVKLDTPSGNSTFDRNAQRAILESSPLPPLPFAYSGTYLGVHLTFK